MKGPEPGETQARTREASWLLTPLNGKQAADV